MRPTRAMRTSGKSKGEQIPPLALFAVQPELCKLPIALALDFTHRVHPIYRELRRRLLERFGD